MITTDEEGFVHRRIDVGEVTLHVAEARPSRVALESAPLVVLLHGFPEFWWSWRHQMRALAGAGLWAVAPDMRGFNDSDKPVGVASYDRRRITADVEGLVRALGRDRADVVGHDWGGEIAWNVAQHHASIVRRLAILNVPHPLVMVRSLATARQLRKSWYIFFFQLPKLPELCASRNDFAAMRNMFRKDGIPEEEIDRYVEALAKPGALTSGMNYYRAAARDVLRRSARRTRVIEHPVLVIWGDGDRVLGKELAEPPPRFVPNARTVHLPGKSHWVQSDAKDEVNRLLLEFLAPA